MSDQIMIGNCPECGHFPSQLVGDAESLDYVIHLPEKDYGCQAGPHKRIHQLEAQLEQERARVSELEADQEYTKGTFLCPKWAKAQLLRKQAEAVEAFGAKVAEGLFDDDDFDVRDITAGDVQTLADFEGSHLRNQADDAEKGGK